MHSGSSASGGVSVFRIDGVGRVLVDANGDALYSSDQERKGAVLCVEGCLAFWDPLTLSKGEAPIGDAGVQAMLGTTRRPDGSEQITFAGRPLYRFTEDSGPGVVSGDGFEDSFGGQSFTWHVAKPAKASTSAPTPTSPRDGYDYGS